LTRAKTKRAKWNIGSRLTTLSSNTSAQISTDPGRKLRFYGNRFAVSDNAHSLVRFHGDPYFTVIPISR